MKTFLIALFFVCTASGTETADDLARRINIGWTPFDNGLNKTPEGQRDAALTNAEFELAHFMASDKVPESVRISYALNKLKAQMRGSSFKEAVQADAEEFAFEEDQKDANVVYEARTLVMREDLPKKIEILEKRLVAIYNPHKEAEQDGTGQPATRSQSKSKGSDKPQLEAEGRSR